MSDLRLYGTVLATADDLAKVSSAGVLDGYDRPLALLDFDPDRLSVLVCKALLTQVGGVRVEAYLRCYGLIAVQGQDQPIEVPWLDVPLCLYAQMEVPASVKSKEDRRIDQAIRFNL